MRDKLSPIPEIYLFSSFHHTYKISIILLNLDTFIRYFTYIISNEIKGINKENTKVRIYNKNF